MLGQGVSAGLACVPPQLYLSAAHQNLLSILRTAPCLACTISAVFELTLGICSLYDQLHHCLCHKLYVLLQLASVCPAGYLILSNRGLLRLNGYQAAVLLSSPGSLQQ